MSETGIQVRARGARVRIYTDARAWEIVSWAARASDQLHPRAGGNRAVEVGIVVMLVGVVEMVMVVAAVVWVKWSCLCRIKQAAFS